ncbi:hypothetical protein Dimus_018070, partial [Dionaea muscipula]
MSCSSDFWVVFNQGCSSLVSSFWQTLMGRLFMFCIDEVLMDPYLARILLANCREVVGVKLAHVVFASFAKGWCSAVLLNG